MWHVVQVRSPEQSKNQHILGKIPRFPLSISEINKTYEIRTQTHQDLTSQCFRLTEGEILKFYQVDGLTTEQSQISVLKGTFDFA